MSAPVPQCPSGEYLAVDGLCYPESLNTVVNNTAVDVTLGGRRRAGRKGRKGRKASTRKERKGRKASTRKERKGRKASTRKERKGRKASTRKQTQRR